MILSLLFILIGALLWYKEEKKGNLLNPPIAFSIACVLFGAGLLFSGVNEKEHIIRGNDTVESKSWHWFFILSLIFIGSVSYTIAAYFHLKLEQWTFLKAFLIAVPFLLIEYQFSLRGNYYAKKHLLMNAVQITILTMIFYFFNAWLLNYFVLKQPMIWWRELLAFMFIVLAFLTTTSLK
jgi:dipeptide/tripeptide permease